METPNGKIVFYGDFIKRNLLKQMGQLCIEKLTHFYSLIETIL
jgi:hypothetical protein